MCNSIIANYKKYISLGVWADFEYDSDKYIGKDIGKKQRSNLVKEFINQIQNYGYECGLYANPDYIENKFDMPLFKNQKLWLAYYNTTDSKAKKYNPYIWQYSSEGQINGIKGNVDVNYLYEVKEPPKKEDPKYYGIVTTKGGNLNVRDGAGTKFKQIGKIPNGKEIEIMTKDNNWYKINYKGLIGYVSKTYIKEK